MSKNRGSYKGYLIYNDDIFVSYAHIQSDFSNSDNLNFELLDSIIEKEILKLVSNANIYILNDSKFDCRSFSNNIDDISIKQIVDNIFSDISNLDVWNDEIIKKLKLDKFSIELDQNINDRESTIQMYNKIDEKIDIQNFTDYDIELKFDSESNPQFVSNDENLQEKLDNLDTFLVNWYHIYRYECNCDDFIVVESEIEHNFHRNDIDYCKYCGRDNWNKGVYKVTQLYSQDEITEIINSSEISESNTNIIKSIYPKVVE